MTISGLHDRHRAVMPSWLALYYERPIEIVRGQGRRVVDAEGNTYLDFFGGIMVNMLGYDVPEVREAARRQLETGVTHTSTLYLIGHQITLAERIARISGIPGAKVFFVNSGSEAMEVALLLATEFRHSNQVLALRNSYHGRAFGANGVSGISDWSPSSLSPLQVIYVQNGCSLRGPLCHVPRASIIDACVDDLRELLVTATAGDVACLVAEPIQGVGGLTVPPDGLLAAYKNVLDEHGILFVSDEVQTGWGRTGERFWGIQAHDVVPDIMTFAKGLGNGLAIGGVVARAELLDCLTAKYMSTFGGNPLSTAVGNATLDYLLSHDLQTNAEKVGAHLMSGLRRAIERCDVVGEVRGKGLIIGVELVVPGSTIPHPHAALRVLESTRGMGLLVGKGGLYGNVLRITPPLTLTEAEADEGLEILVEAIAREQSLVGSGVSNDGS